MKKSFLLLLIGLSFVSGLSQSIPQSANLVKDGHREGRWTIWMDGEWRPTHHKDSMVYYRQITYAGGKPQGIVKDFFRNGKVQWEGYLLSDAPVDVIHGTATWYYEHGTIKEQAEFDNGTRISTRAFLEDGREDKMLTLVSNAGLAHYNGNYEQALSLYQDALGMAEKESGAKGRAAGDVLFKIGSLLSEMGDYEGAESRYLSAAEIYKAVVGEKHEDFAVVLNQIALVNKEMGRFKKAEPLYLQAIDILRSLSPGSINHAATLTNLALMYVSAGRFDEAESLYKEALAMLEELSYRGYEYSVTLDNLAALYRDTGKFDMAEPVQLKALEVMKELVGDQHVSYATSLMNTAALFQEMGRYRQAEEYFSQSLEITRMALGEEHPYYATNLHNLASLYVSLSAFAKAEPLFLRVMELDKATLGEAHPNYAATLLNLAVVYQGMGHYAKAEKFFQDALNIYKAQGEYHPEYVNTLHNLGVLYAEMGKFREAEGIFLKTLGNRIAIYGRRNPNVATSYSSLANLYRINGKNEEAEKYYTELVNARISQIETFFPIFSESEKEHYLESVEDGFELYKSFGLSRASHDSRMAGAVYDIQLFTKALLLNNTAKWKQRIRNSGDTTLLSNYRKWEDNQASIVRLYRAADSLQRGALDSLVAVTNSIEKDLSRQSEIFAQLADKQRYTWKDVQKKLRPDEAAVEMIRIRKYGTGVVVDSSGRQPVKYQKHGLVDTVYYAALILTRQSRQPAIVIVDNGNALETRDLRYYRNCISGHIGDDQSYNRFWRPIGKALGRKIRRIYFSPDGVYNSVNLNTLQNPDTKRFLIEELDLRLVTNTKDLVAVRRDAPSNNVAYLFGYPNYQLSKERRAELAQERPAPVHYALNLQRGAGLVELPGTKTEVENIASLMTSRGWKPEVLTGDIALEESLKSTLRPRVLHLATHGYFEPDSVLSRVANPLLQSGLMLAGAARSLQGDKDSRIEDGVLTAFEAMNLHLDNTDLVVLSACETGLGEIRNGEGVYGLQRAFKVAGARSIIMSLWKVNDQATQELVTEFYRHWLEEGDKRLAFKNAQLSLRKKYDHPVFWGAFVMVGD